MPRAPRLIHPVLAVLHRLDASATWGVDPPGYPTHGFDEDFDEYVVYDDPDRTHSRQELAPIEIKVQVEQEAYEQLAATFGGDSPVTDTVLVAHVKDLDAAGLIDSDGRLQIPKGTRVEKLIHPITREQVSPEFSEMYVYEARPRSWGFSTRRRMNLYVLYFYKRGQVGTV